MRTVMSAHAPPDSSKTKYEPVDSNAHHVVGTEDDNDCPAVGLLRLNALPERLVEDPPQVSYGDESVCDAFRSRVGWLGLFLIGLWSAAFIIDAFEKTLQVRGRGRVRVSVSVSVSVKGEGEG